MNYDAIIRKSRSHCRDGFGFLLLCVLFLSHPHHFIYGCGFLRRGFLFDDGDDCIDLLIGKSNVIRLSSLGDRHQERQHLLPAHTAALKDESLQEVQFRLVDSARDGSFIQSLFMVKPPV